MDAIHQVTADPLAANKLVVRNFFDLAFTQRRPADATARFISSPPTMPHTARLPSSRAYSAAVIGWLETMPRLTVELVRLVCEGDLVVAQSRFTPAPGLRAMMVLDLFKLRDGKIVEHWDGLQQAREPTVPLPVE